MAILVPPWCSFSTETRVLCFWCCGCSLLRLKMTLMCIIDPFTCVFLNNLKYKVVFYRAVRLKTTMWVLKVTFFFKTPYGTQFWSFPVAVFLSRAPACHFSVLPLHSPSISVSRPLLWGALQISSLYLSTSRKAHHQTMHMWTHMSRSREFPPPPSST